MSKKYQKRITRYNTRKFAQFYEFVKFIIGPNGLVIAPFHFLRPKIFSNLFCDLVRAFFILFGQGGVCIFKIT